MLVRLGDLLLAFHVKHRTDAQRRATILLADIDLGRRPAVRREPEIGYRRRRGDGGDRRQVMQHASAELRGGFAQSKWAVGVIGFRRA